MQRQVARTRSWIGKGYVQPNANAEVYTTVNSAFNEPSGEYECANKEQISQAITLAANAQEAWQRKAPVERGRVLLECARLLRAKNAEIARLETLNTSRALAETIITDVVSAADCFEFFGGNASVQQMGEYHQCLGGNMAYVRREPLGVTAGIGAFNYPLQSAAWKSAPALAFGNAMIFKPAEDTPLSALALAETLREAGLPDGLFSVLLGRGADVGQHLVADERIAKISFTGSVRTGTRIAAQAASECKSVTLELGGKSPLIVFEDADLDQAVIGALLANFYSNGQICSNGTRIYVQSGMYDAFLDLLKQRVTRLRIGDPMREDTDLGPLIHEAHLQKVLGFVERAEREGAKLECGGRRVTRAQDFYAPNQANASRLLAGAFMTPAVLSHVGDEFEIAKQEVFGPVACVFKFDTEEEVLLRANASNFGLAAGVFTKDLARAHRTIAQLKAGCCWINHFNLAPVELPWGGYKQSGLGRENGTAAVNYWTQTKSVHVDLAGIPDPYPHARKDK